MWLTYVELAQFGTGLLRVWGSSSPRTPASSSNQCSLFFWLSPPHMPQGILLPDPPALWSFHTMLHWGDLPTL